MSRFHFLGHFKDNAFKVRIVWFENISKIVSVKHNRTHKKLADKIVTILLKSEKSHQNMQNALFDFSITWQR